MSENSGVGLQKFHCIDVYDVYIMMFSITKWVWYYWCFDVLYKPRTHLVSKLSYTYSIQIYIKIQISKQILQYSNNFIFDNWGTQDIYTYIKECVTNKYKNKTNELYIIFSFKHSYDLN